MQQKESVKISQPIYMKFANMLPPQVANSLGLRLLDYWHFNAKTIDQKLRQTYFGLDFSHPLGIAAGCDKNAISLAGLDGCGCSFFEVGTVTPKVQEIIKGGGVFRIKDKYALVNKMGFPNEGAAKISDKIRRWKKNNKQSSTFGINIGPNRESADIIEDIKQNITVLGKLCDFITINISSPNCAGLKDWQEAKKLTNLIDAVKKHMIDLGVSSPLFVKLSPDIGRQQERNLFECIDQNVNGLIISNTIGYSLADRDFQGGLSGKPLFEESTEMLHRAFKHFQGKVILIGCGGIFSGKDAWTKIISGANLLQVYTGFSYLGPVIFKNITEYLSALCVKHNLKNITEAIGRYDLKEA